MTSLPALLALLHALERPSVSTYVAAMADGQYRRAAELIRPAAQDNDTQAQNRLANLYYLGMGVELDYQEAARLYHAAASNSYAPAGLNLGHLYAQGLGVPRNTERAFAWYVHADIAGDPAAEYYISQLAVELTLTPLQMATLRERYKTLDLLAAEPL